MNNVSTEEIGEYLVLLKRIVKDGVVKIKMNREKNSVFAYLYSYDEFAIKNQLLSLNPDDFEELIISKESKHVGDKLYVWSPSVILTAADGVSSEDKLYIKTHIDEKNRLIVISFHRYNDFS